MADKTKNINLEITAKNKASAALKQVGNELDEVNSKQNSVGTSGSKLTSTLATMATKIAPVAIAYMAVNKALEMTIALCVKSVEEYKGQVAADAELRNSLGYTSKSLQKYASELQNITLFTDDATLSSMAQIGAFVKDENQIKALTKAAQDLAAAKKMDLKSATDVLMRSVVAGTDNLKQYGIRVADISDQEERLTAIVEGVNQAYGGRAEALAATPVGKIEQMNNALGDMQEQLGEQVVPLMLKWKEVLGAISALAIPILTGLLKGVNKVTGSMGTFEEQTTQLLDKAKELGGLEGASFLETQMGKSEEFMARNKAMLTEYYYLLETGQKSAATKTLTRIQAEREEVKQTETRIRLMKELYDQLIANSMAQQTITGEAPEKKKKEDTDKSKEWRKNFVNLEESLRSESDQDYRNKIVEELEYIYKMKMLYYDKELEAYKSLEEQFFSVRKSYDSKMQSYHTKTLDERTSDLANQFQVESDLWKMNLDNQLITQQEYDDLMIEMRKDYQNQELKMVFEHWSDMSSKVAEIANTLMGTIQQINQITTEKELKNIDDVTDSRKRSATKYITNKKLLENELEKIDKEAAKRREEISKREKQIAMIMAIINTAQGVTKALASSGPPLNFIMAGLVGVAGAIQVGLIASQAFAEGGIVQPNGGPATGDKTTVRVNPGEMILNQRQQRNLLAIANSPSNAAGGGVSIQETIVVQGNMDSSAIQELKQHREEWLEMLRDSNKQLNYRGYTYA